MIARQPNYERTLKVIEANTRKAVQHAGFTIQAETKTTLSRHGSTRKSGNIPSPPGSPPAVQTGTLRRSIQVDDRKLGQPNPAVRVGTNLVYAPIHEFGGVINHPGGTPYIIVSDKGGRPRAVFLRKSSKLTTGGVGSRNPRQQRQTGPRGGITKAFASGRAIKFTKPHKIRMPARPYMRPSFLAVRARILKLFGPAFILKGL